MKTCSGCPWLFTDETQHTTYCCYNPEPHHRSPLHPRCSKRVQNQKDASDSPILKGKLAELFDQFWELYPRKQKRKDAQYSWKKIKPDDHLFAEILGGLEYWKVSRQWMKDDGQFIPTPPAWLNREGWKERLETSSLPVDDERAELERRYGG